MSTAATTSPLTRAIGLAGGTVLAQAIALVMAPVLTRLYSPTDFGTFATFTAISGFFPAIICLRYEHAVVTAKADDEVIGLFAISALVALIISALIGLVTLMMRPSTFRLGDGGSLVPAVLYGSSALAAGLGSAFSSMMLRQQQFRMLSITKFLPALLTAGLQVLFAKTLSNGGMGLILATVAGQIGLVIIGASAVQRTVRQVVTRFAHIEYRRLLRQHRDWPLRELPGALLAATGVGLPLLLIARRFGDADAGHFSLAMRALAIPVSVIGASLSQVYFAHASRLQTESSAIARFTVDTVRLVGRCTVPVTLTLGLFGEETFAWAFGTTWAPAGHMGALLSPFLLSWMTFSTIMPLLYAKNRLGLVIIAHAIASSRFLPLLWPGQWPSVEAAVLAFSLAGFGCYVVVGAMLLRLVDADLITFAKQLLRQLIRDWPWLGFMAGMAGLGHPLLGVLCGGIWAIATARKSFAFLKTDAVSGALDGARHL